ncbi:hypothetical protein C8R44DRAFT_825824 [Mycena epipterygia]|nr:hypothetical protein C8R44DRAFT_825824 [Mycena epipterygia]
MHNLAYIYYDMGKLEEAEKLEVAVVEKQRNILGEDHPHTQLAMELLESISKDLAESKAGEVESIK